jgi:anti-anti-sigma factor
MSLQQNAPSPRAVHHDFRPPQFRCTTSHPGVRAVWVEVSGDLDLVTAPELARALRAAAKASRLTVLDVHALTFIDSSGVHVIEDASLHALLHGRRLVVSRAPGHFRRILALTGTFTAIELRDVNPAPVTTLV